MREYEFLANGSAKDLSDLRRWERLPAPRNGFRVKNRDGSFEEYEQATPQGIFLTSLTDIYGNITSISYSPNSPIPTLLTLPAKRGVVRYESDGTHVTQIIPPTSGPSSLHYSESLLHQVRGAAGTPRLEIGYDGMGYGLPTSLTLANGDTTRFWFKVPSGPSGPAVLYKVKGPSQSTSYLTHSGRETTMASGESPTVLKVSFATNPITGKVYQKELYKNSKLIKRVELEPQTGRPLTIQSANKKKVTFSYDPAGTFDSRNVSSPIVTGIRQSSGESTVFSFDPNNRFRTQRIAKTHPTGLSQVVQFSWDGAQLREKTTRVNGALTHKATYQYVGRDRYPAAVSETEVNRLTLNERGVPVGGTSADGHAWSLSTTPNLLKLSVDGVLSTTATSYSADGVLTEISDQGTSRLIRVVSADGLKTLTKVQVLKSDSTLSGPSPRASLLLDLVYAQAGGSYTDVGSESCGPSGGSIQGPGGPGGGSGGGSGAGGPGGASHCYEKTSEETAAGGKTTENSEINCDGGGSGGGSDSSSSNPSSKSSSGSSSSGKGDGSEKPEEKEPKEPRVPRAGDIYRGIDDELSENLDYASNFVSSLPEGIAESYNDEVEGFADALADLPNVAADVFNTYFGSDSYESQSNLFKAVENGDVSIGDVAVDLGTMGLSSVASASWSYANGGSGEEFSKAMGAFGGMTIAGAAIGEAGSLGFRNVRGAIGRRLGRGGSRAAAEAGEVAAEKLHAKPPPTEVEPVNPPGPKGICVEERVGPSRNTAEWPQERIPQTPWAWESNPRYNFEGEPSGLVEVREFVEAIKNFPEITEPPEIVEWGIDSGRAWVKISAEGQEGIWYRSSGKAGSDPNTKYPGEWLPIAGKMGNWFAKDVEAIAYIKQGDAFTR